MDYDHALIARARAAETPENRHDLNNAIAIYGGVVELFDASPEARELLPRIVDRLEEYALTRRPPRG